MKKRWNLAVLFSLCVIAGILFSGSGFAATAPAKGSLGNEDCVKCHAGPPADIAAAGSKHKNVACQDCHNGHPPQVKKPIPLCSQCHQGKAHFELKDCLQCHTNPHTPLKITLKGSITDPCLTCHDAQIKQLREHKSKHTLLSCTTCHGGLHKQKPECTKCHKPHSSNMVAKDCSGCHKAHMPKNVMYGEVSSNLCASCHKAAFDLLKASSAKHKAFECAFCHKAKHKAVPKCQDCHGDKHPAAIMAKFTKCGDCHKIAHDLNNWQSAAPASGAAPSKKAEAPKKGKKH